MRNVVRLLVAAAFGAMLLLPGSATAKTLKVSPGDSIQAAVDQARPGDTVRIAPGVYTEAGRQCPARPSRTCAVVVTKDDIGIVGRQGAHGGRVVLEATGGQEEGIEVGHSRGADCLTDRSLRVHGSLIKGLTVRGFEDDGVLLSCVERWRITRVIAVDNGEYGTFPSHVFGGRLDHSFAAGANDTGHYVGQSFHVRMDHNVATDNVSGFEIENSVGVRADHNVATGNTGGILSFNLPFLDVKMNDRNVIDHNLVRDNNRPNTCTDPDDAVCAVPAGTGILMMATDNNLARSNRVSGNGSFGIAVANICVAQNIPADQCAALDIEPNPDGNRVMFNSVFGNGGNPAPTLPPMFAQDLVWDGTGDGNCWFKNRFGTSFPDPLPACANGAPGVKGLGAKGLGKHGSPHGPPTGHGHGQGHHQHGP